VFIAPAAWAVGLTINKFLTTKLDSLLLNKFILLSGFTLLSLLPFVFGKLVAFYSIEAIDLF